MLTIIFIAQEPRSDCIGEGMEDVGRCQIEPVWICHIQSGHRIRSDRGEDQFARTERRQQLPSARELGAPRSSVSLLA